MRIKGGFAQIMSRLSDQQMESEIWKIWSEVHDQIPRLREEAYTILGCYDKQSLGSWRLIFGLKKKDIPKPQSKASSGGQPNEAVGLNNETPVPNESLEDRAKRATRLAGKFQAETQQIRDAKPIDILDITRRAGHLLGETENLIPDTAGTAVTRSVLSAALLVVTTARGTCKES
jgi:hypothetical protein